MNYCACDGSCVLLVMMLALVRRDILRLRCLVGLQRQCNPGSVGFKCRI